MHAVRQPADIEVVQRDLNPARLGHPKIHDPHVEPVAVGEDLAAGLTDGSLGVLGIVVDGIEIVEPGLTRAAVDDVDGFEEIHQGNPSTG